MRIPDDGGPLKRGRWEIWSRSHLRDTWRFNRTAASEAKAMALLSALHEASKRTDTRGLEYVDCEYELRHEEPRATNIAFWTGRLRAAAAAAWRELWRAG